ncbi:reverse transcriptase [Gossypium australe]|uniref:Reverse transcriptase n=1 Tax=Gossypium australe TaxID=47621 RepID=A0A5B6WF63_9ROSI|nr:reverse transcriptase [Gossypium australe]
MTVKLDMSKAYNRVEWNFVKEMMKRMGFDLGWVDSIMKSVSRVSYSVVFNGHIGENGDPLSPFLFLICGKGLSSPMRLVMKEDLLRGVKQVDAARRSRICYSQTIAIGRGVHLLKRILHEYENCSGQCVNYDKSTDGERTMISNALGVQSSNDPERYLGLPNMVGRKKKLSFQNLKDRFNVKHLSQGGKEVFIKAILQSIPTYTMACFLLPKTLSAELESIITKFWWQKSRGKKGIHWCVWKDFCSLKENGGLGFRNRDKFNVAMLAKKARVLKAKYYPNSNFINAQLGDLPSLTWKCVWAAKELLESSLCWRVRMGDRISVWGDLWILGADADGLHNDANNENIKYYKENSADSFGGDNTRRLPSLERRTFRRFLSQKCL